MPKAKKEYVLDEDGNRIRDASGRWKSRKIMTNDWNNLGNCEVWRNAWETIQNEYLERNGECMFSDLITRRGNELDVICAFIAILEAVKFKMAEIYQHRIFGDIKICRKKQAA